jgi:hypothetical protein
VLASLPTAVKTPTDVYVEAAGSFTATEPGKEANIAVSLGSQLERAPQQIAVTAVGGRSTPFTIASTVKLIGASQVGEMKVTNTIALRATQTAPGAGVKVGKINIVAIVLPPLAKH